MITHEYVQAPVAEILPALPGGVGVLRSRRVEFLALIIVSLSLFCSGCASVFSVMEIPPPVFTGVQHRDVPQSSKLLDIPRYDESRGDFAGKPFVYYSWAKAREEQLNLESPEISETDQIIRVWGTFSYHPRRQKGFLAEFVHDGSLWHGHFYDYLIFYNPWGNTEEIKDMQSFTLVPESGWDNFEEILKETKLVSLSTDEKVPGLSEWVLRNGICTAATYSVEYSTPIQYRFFIYQNPQETQAQFREAANFMRFHDYLFEMVQHSDPLQSGEQ
ncbi:MAG: hypothetical protein GX804_05850 [Lentisphaerae bacterium]|jgi:hypothetical protein|nr:hypothetical protein [Lentisphaerota bacterium]